MRAPLTFVYGNCVFAGGPTDAWAAFAVELSGYGWLSEDAKRARFLALLGALEALEADVQILRVGRHVGARPLRTGARCEMAARGARSSRTCARRRHMRQNTSAGCFARRGEASAVHSRQPARTRARRRHATCRELRREPRDGGLACAAAALLGERSPAARGRDELERAARARRPDPRAPSRVPASARPARGVELQWLVRRAFCRGLGEPVVDGLHEPRALVFERNGEAVLAPLEADVMRWIGRLRRASRPLPADRVGAGDELAGAAGARRAARASCSSRARVPS